MSCWTTYTGAKTRRLLKTICTYRRCIQEKSWVEALDIVQVLRIRSYAFADKDRHMLFLEPEGRYTNEWYINGLSTSLPLKVQVEMLRSIDGLENVHILRPAMRRV